MKFYLYFSAFITGLASLAVELAASRLLGAYFGTSNLVWAAIIGLILLYLTAGYFLGGAWADRSPRPLTLYAIMAWAGLGVALVPVVARPLLLRAATAFDQLQIGVLLGAFFSVLVLFSLPITLLGMVSPFVIRIVLGGERGGASRSGHVAGRVYAVSTLGSFVGTFLPDLLLIPLLGTRRTFLLLGLALVLAALLGMALTRPRRALLYLWMPVLIAALWLGWANKPIKNTAGQIYETESAYNYIQVLQVGDFRLLRLNEGQGIHSVYHPKQIAYHGSWMMFLAAPYFYAKPSLPRRMAIVGLAAGTVARQATAAFGPIPIDGYEIDPEIVRVGSRYFGLDALPNLNAHIEDGRVGIRRSPYRYDLIVVDAFRPPYIPWHLTTREFFELLKARLSERGAVAVNVGILPDDRRLMDDIAATMRAVFPSVYAARVPNAFNAIVYATNQPTQWGNLRANMAAVQSNPMAPALLVQAMEMAVSNRLRLGRGEVFTDDRAPVDLIADSMVLRYALEAGDAAIR